MEVGAGAEAALVTWEEEEEECLEAAEGAGGRPCRGDSEAEEGAEGALVIMADTLEADQGVTLETLVAAT